jgi:purine catabolism regulator
MGGLLEKEMGLPTVHEVWRLALPEATRLVNAGGDHTRPVSWARRMAHHAPAFGTLDEGEIVLLDVDAIRPLDDRLTLAKVIRSLGQRGVAALAVIGRVSGAACQEADRRALCLFCLPDDADLRDVERDVVRLIVEREAQLDRRGRQVYRQLAQLSIENQGLPAIAEALVRIVHKPVVIQDEQLEVQAMALPPDAPEARGAVPEIGALVADPGVLHRWLRDQRACGELDGKAPPCTELPLGDHSGQVRCVAAIVIDGRLGGVLSILGLDHAAAAPLDDLDHLAAERGALVCAVELAKQRAVHAAEKRVHGDFLDLLLTASASEERALARRAAEYGYELARHHTVLLWRTGETDSDGWARVARAFRARLFHSGIQVLLCPHEGMLAALCSAEDVAPLGRLEEHAQQTYARLAEGEPPLPVAVGIGRPGAGLVGLRRSFAQAREALALVESLFDGDRVLSFGDLTLYHLLGRLQSCDELGEFYDQTLAALVDYDRGHDTQLVDTLGAFFAQHGNVSQTAERLFLHRNSLLYRLERIADITGLNLDDADDRFALQLALKLRPFLAAGCPA